MYDMDEIYRRYFTDVYRYLLTLCRSAAEAEELTQETFWRAMQKLGSFREECTPYAWLCQIGKNLYLSAYRRQKRTQPLDGLFETPDSTEGPEQQVTDSDTADRLHCILHGLPEPYKEVFTLRTLGELPFAKIASLFGKTESWARVTYHRAKWMIREEIEK